MFRRPPQAKASFKVVEVQENAKTARTFARWDAGKRILPAFFGSASAVGVALVQQPASGLNYILATALAILVPGGLVRIVWDTYQKKGMRERLDELEKDNRELVAEASELRRQLPRGGP